jgi:hypothetical protein
LKFSPRLFLRLGRGQSGACRAVCRAAGYGWFMVPIGWKWALLIWGYALAWFLVNDRIKLAAYRILDPTQPVLTTKH